MGAVVVPLRPLREQRLAVREQQLARAEALLLDARLQLARAQAIRDLAAERVEEERAALENPLARSAASNSAPGSPTRE